jgi:hypothetical protein
MNPQEIEGLEEFFRSLPRPLPAGLKLTQGVKVTDPETFIRTQINLVKAGSRSAYANVCLERLLQWKDAYLLSATSKN